MDQIDLQPLKPGWGMIWQGSEWAAFFDEVPKPRFVVSLIGESEPFASGSLTLWLLDNETDTLDDKTLLTACDAAIAFLSGEYNLLIHCFQGKYRSTYVDVAIHMRSGMMFEEAYALVRSRHTIAELRAGTMAQLKRMESVLRGA